MVNKRFFVKDLVSGQEVMFDFEKETGLVEINFKEEYIQLDLEDFKGLIKEL